MTYSIKKIVDKYLDTDWIKIINGLNKEIATIMQFSKQSKDDIEYIKASKEILFLLQYGTKPNGLDKNEMELIKPLTQNLINKGQLKNEIISVFD